MKLNLRFVIKTPKQALDNEIIFVKDKRIRNKILKPLNNDIFSNKLFLEENFLRKT